MLKLCLSLGRPWAAFTGHLIRPPLWPRNLSRKHPGPSASSEALHDMSLTAAHDGWPSVSWSSSPPWSLHRRTRQESAQDC
jgi:hypothetical protein